MADQDVLEKKVPMLRRAEHERMTSVMVMVTTSCFTSLFACPFFQRGELDSIDAEENKSEG
jgi:hypothetical protein